jgi:hypothetical protein
MRAENAPGWRRSTSRYRLGLELRLSLLIVGVEKFSSCCANEIRTAWVDAVWQEQLL